MFHGSISIVYSWMVLSSKRIHFELAKADNKSIKIYRRINMRRYIFMYDGTIFI